MKDVDKFANYIKVMQIQGARSIAVESLKFLKVFCKKNGFGRNFVKAADRLEKMRPTAVVLHNCLEIVREEKSIRSIDMLLNRFKKMSPQIAENGSKIIKDGSVIMTHCHSGEALSAIMAAKSKKISVIATITEPFEQGVMTVKELAEANIPVTLILDSAVSYFMKDVDLVIIGSDALRREGNVNKIGSLNIAVSARNFKKPYYIVADTLKLDNRKKLLIEERSSEEVHEKIRNVVIKNPVFDITPWKYVTRVITEKGVMTPGNILRLLR